MKINLIGHLVNVGKTNPNKPKVKIGKMNVTSFITMAYENKSNWTLGKRGKNKPKQTQSQNRQNEHNFFENNELRTSKSKTRRRLTGSGLCKSGPWTDWTERTMNDEKNKPKQSQSEFIHKAAQFPTGELLGIFKPGTKQTQSCLSPADSNAKKYAWVPKNVDNY